MKTSLKLLLKSKKTKYDLPNLLNEFASLSAPSGSRSAEDFNRLNEICGLITKEFDPSEMAVPLALLLAEAVEEIERLREEISEIYLGFDS